MQPKKKLRFVGIVSRPLGTDGTFILADTERHVSPMQSHADIHIGYSVQFTKQFTLISCKKHGTGYAMKVQEITAPESVQSLREQAVYVDEEMLVKHKDEYYVDEVVGCMVIDDAFDTVYGCIVDVWTLPANDAWVMIYDGKEIPIPVIPQIIRSVNILQKVVRVTLHNGLLTLFDHDIDIDRDEEE